jgi:hypothetical protein
LPDPVRRKERGEFTVAAGLLLTTLAATVVDVPRTPVFSRAAAKNPAQVVQVPNLLTTTLAEVAPPAGTPFLPVDLGNPGQKRPAQQSQPTNFLPLSTFVPPAASPFVPADLPQPKARQQRQSFQQPSLLGTLLQPIVVGEEQTRAPYFVPRFKKDRQQPQLDPNRLALTTVQVVPYRPTDDQWPNPVRRKPGQHDVGQNRLALTFTLESRPFVTPDLPHPARAKYSPQTWDRASWFVLLAKPVTQASLDVPVRRRAQDTGSTASGLALTTQQPQASPFIPAMQQNPAARRAVQVQYEANRLPIVSFVAPTGTPFSQHEWITPPKVRYSPARHDVQVNLLALGIPEPGAVVPGDTNEWIIRARRRGRR